MYGYIDDYQPLTIENILLRISQQDIFAYLLDGEIPDVNKEYLSIVRPDNNANCNFIWYEGKLLFVDFGNKKTHLDCFGVISQRENLSLKESMEFVNNNFQLGLDGMGEPKPIKYELINKEVKKKVETNIIFKPKSFSVEDLRFWNSFGISKNELIKDSVFSVLWYKFFSKRIQRTVIVRPKQPTFAYYEFKPRVKIYSPFKPKKRGKWISSTITEDIGNIDNLPINGELLVITKSYKDCRCLLNYGINCIWFQSEGMLPEIERIINLCKRFIKIVVIYDNDSQGIIAAENTVQIINSFFPNKASSINIPLIKNVKDPSDFYKSQGKIKLLNYLTINKLI